MKTKKPKPIVAWAGFVNGKMDSGWYGIGPNPQGKTQLASIFTNPSAAREWFQDVRRVQIIELPRKS